MFEGGCQGPKASLTRAAERLRQRSPAFRMLLRTDHPCRPAGKRPARPRRNRVPPVPAAESRFARPRGKQPQWSKDGSRLRRPRYPLRNVRFQPARFALGWKSVTISVPAGATARASSVTVVSAGGMCPNERAHRTMSAQPFPTGRARLSAKATRPRNPGFAAASASIAGLRSKPVACAPAWAACASQRPVPHDASMNLFPRRSPSQGAAVRLSRATIGLGSRSQLPAQRS